MRIRTFSAVEWLERSERQQSVGFFHIMNEDPGAQVEAVWSTVTRDQQHPASGILLAVVQPANAISGRLLRDDVDGSCIKDTPTVKINTKGCLWKWSKLFQLRGVTRNQPEKMRYSFQISVISASLYGIADLEGN